MRSVLKNPSFEKWSNSALRENNTSFCDGWFVEFAGNGFTLQPLQEQDGVGEGVRVSLHDNRSWVRLWQPLRNDRRDDQNRRHLQVTLSAPSGVHGSNILQWVALLTTDTNGKRIFHHKIVDAPVRINHGGTIALDCILEPSDMSRDLLLSLHFSGGPGQFELASVTSSIRPHSTGSLGALPNPAKISVSSKASKVCIVSHDHSDGSSRAWTLAEMASKSHRVELIGPCFGDALPPTLSSGATIHRRSFAATDMSSFLKGAIVTARNTTCDIVHVVKPRLSSLVLGHLIRQRNKCRMLVDLDDRELAYVVPREPAGLDEVLAAMESGDKSLETPESDLWTRFAETLLVEADMTTTSNVALQKRFDGFLIRDARDEAIFEPANYDRRLTREAFGYGPNDRVILFDGLGLQHRALLEVASALERIGDPRFVICAIGAQDDALLAHRLQAFRSIRVDLRPAEPPYRMAELFNIADAVAILPDPDHPSSAFRLSQSLASALAMGVPVLTRITPALHDIALSAPFTPVFDETSLDLALMSLGHPHQRSAQHARDYFLSEMSYGVNAARLDKAYEAVTRRARAASPLLDKTIDILSGKIDLDVSQPLRRPALRRADPPRDLVFLWKQNDSDLYGRRSDMLVRQMLYSGKVRRIIHLDAPIGLDELEQLAEASVGQVAHHGGAIYSNTVRRILRQADTPGLVRRTFLHRGKTAATRAFGRTVPDRGSYSDFVRQLMKDEKIQPNPLLWISPIAPDYAAVMEVLEPQLIVADLIDDQRVFPGSSQAYRRNADAAYEAVLQDADIVLANCEPLRVAFSHLRSDIHLVPNGSDIAREDIVADIEVASLPRPIIGYVGNLRDRINLPLLERIAKAYPEGSVVLVGTTHGRSEFNDLAARNPNVRLLGIKPYPQALGIIKAFDAAIMPHLKNEQTDRMNPLKLYVYASVGTPTVSSSVANIDDVARYVQLADDDDDFLRKLELTLQREGWDSMAKARKTILEEHSWERRVDAIWKLLSPHDS